jgi:phytoene synthase
MSLPAPTMSVTEESRAVLSKHGRSFALAGIFLPGDQLDDAAVAYAFCRLADDLVDEAPDRETAHRDITALRAELSGAAAPRPVVAAYVEMASRRGFPLSVAHDLIAGVLSDLDAVRVADDDELELYCYRVAGTVGLMMSAIMGVQSPRAAAPAKALGEAMQLTNICRDVLEDTRRDRCYLPDDRLIAVGASGDLVVSGDAEPEAVRLVVSDLLDRADALYREAWLGMHHIPWRPRLAIHVALRVYRQIGVRLRRDHGGDPLHGRTIVPTGERLLMVGRGLLDAVFGAPEIRG